MIGIGFDYNPGGMFVPGAYSEDVIERSLQRASLQRDGGDVLSDFFMPKDKEERQMGQQLFMDYAEPQARMQGLIAAGINPLTAAAGIAGSNPGNIPSPSASTNPIGDVAGAAGAIAGGVNSLGAASKAFQEAEQVKPLAESTISKNNAEIDKWSHENGFTDAQTEAFNIDNQTRDTLNRAELNIKRQQYRKMRIEAEYINEQKNYISKQIQWYDEQIQAEIDLAKKRSLEAEKHAFLMEEQTRTEKMENDFASKYGYRREQPFDSAMLSCWFNGEYDKVEKAQNFMYDMKYGVSHAEESAKQHAISQYAYIIANAQETAKSLNSIVTDWNQPATSLWSLIEKSFNVSGNKNNANIIDSALSAKNDPDTWAGYSQFVVSLQMSLEQVNHELEVASAANDFGKIRELTKQRYGLQEFMKRLTFEDYQKHLHQNPN